MDALEKHEFGVYSVRVSKHQFNHGVNRSFDLGINLSSGRGNFSAYVRHLINKDLKEQNKK